MRSADAGEWDIGDEVDRVRNNLMFFLWKEIQGKFLDEGEKSANAGKGTDLWDRSSMIFTTGSYKLNFVGFLRQSDAGAVWQISPLDYLN